MGGLTERAQRLDKRIDAALNGQKMRFHDLAVVLWPERKSHRYQANGGPPGCYMALSAGLRRYGFSYTFDPGATCATRWVHPRKAALVLELAKKVEER